MQEEKRLTHLTSAAGWAAKVGPGVLAQVLCSLPKCDNPNLLVGFDRSDDACVYRISDELALVQTVDFFPPMVDDAYTYGQIAAANALSDIYAMGAVPHLAMNLLCYPTFLSPETVRAILAGGADKVQEAGAVLSGGHTIQDKEPKYGLCVSGFVNPAKVLRNAGAHIGDVLVLTKPIGVGVLNTAAKADLLTPEEFQPAVKSMIALNRTAAEVLAGFSVHACTDVTGFGLLGHAYEMADASGVTLRFDAKAVPFFPKAAEFAAMGILPAGVYQTFEYLEGKVFYAPGVKQNLRDLMADPQTSGGLLAALPEAQAQALLTRFADSGVKAFVIGEVCEKGAYPLLVL